MNFQYFFEMLLLNTLLFFLPSVMFARTLRRYLSDGKNEYLLVRILRLIAMGIWLRLILMALLFNHLYYFVESGIF